MIIVDRLVYEYPGKRALDDVSFTIPEGSITALVGPNGAGKTTLLRCIAALDQPFSGAIKVAGVDVSEHPRKVHKELGYLSDFFGLYNDLTVRQCLLYSASLHQLDDEKAAVQTEWAAALLELVPYMNNKAATLSRGWRQRLGIAQAIIHTPRLLLLDEPASGLDPEARIALSQLFRGLRDRGMTLVVSSHILAELEDYCTDMLILRDGKVVEHRTSALSQQAHHLIEVSLLEMAGHAEWLGNMRGVSQVVSAQRSLQFMFEGDEVARHGLLCSFIERGAKVSGFAVRQASLQDVYMSVSTERKKP